MFSVLECLFLIFFNDHIICKQIIFIKHFNANLKSASKIYISKNYILFP